ncbi:MAG TPA: SGNH/GDSL hydrolase family protein [Polyangiaceae bacterium]|nr:SGNH/GDSL hydrolase family protein [Polyangiaceae bacterium]
MRAPAAQHSSLLVAAALGIALVACGTDAASPNGTGGAAATGGSSGSAGAGTAGSGLAGGGSAGSAGAGASSGGGGTAGTNTSGGAGAAVGGMSGSGASGAGGSGGATGGRVGETGGGGSGGDGAAGSASGRAATGGMAGMAAGSGGAGAGTGGAGGTAACEKGTTKGKDVLLIGDSFIALSHDITKDLIAIARDAGALAASDSYRDNSVSGTQLSGGISPQIPVQYANGEKDAPAKVVIMDGGGNDMLNNTCSDPPTESCQAIQNAVGAVRDLLVQMGKDGVETVVYFFYPENQKNATQRAKVDVLRTQLQEVCYSSVSPKCYGVDLRPVFDGHFDEYVLSDGIHPTAAGSQASSEAIWSVMEKNCIAQ